MSIIDVAWVNPNVNIAEDLRAIREQANRRAGYTPIDPVVLHNMLRACDYGWSLQRRKAAKAARRRAKQHRRKQMQKQKQ